MMKQHFLASKRIRIGIVFTVCFLLVLIVESLYSHRELQYDAEGYWEMGTDFMNAGFTMKRYIGIRGYIFPSFLGFANLLGGLTAWRILNALISAVFFVLVIPGLSHQNIDYSAHDVVRIIAFSSLMLLFFVGNFVYPLSDLFALINCVLAIYFLKMAGERQYICYFFAGFFVYMAYNVRTIYLFSFIALVCVHIGVECVRKSEKSQKVKQISRTTLAAGLGTMAAAVPQALNNYFSHGIVSPMVKTDGLMLSQMLWGLQYQRYETCTLTVPNPAHASGSVPFMEPVGLKILEIENITEFANWGEYIRLFFKYPIDIVMVYVRHLINFLFPCFPETYISDLNVSKWMMGLLGYTVLFVAIFGLLNQLYLDYKSLIWWIPIVVPALLIIPGGVEYRFSIGLYAFFFFQLCFNFDYKKLFEILKGGKLKYVALYLIVGVLVFAVWSEMLISEGITPLFF